MADNPIAQSAVDAFLNVLTISAAIGVCAVGVGYVLGIIFAAL